MLAFLQLALQTVKRVISNRHTFLIFSFASLFYLVFYSIPYSNQAITQIHTAIVDMDQSKMSRDLTDELISTPMIFPESVTSDFSQAQADFHLAKFDVMIVIPPDFEADIRRGTPSAVSVFSNGAFPVKGRAVAAMTQLVVGQENIKEAAKRLVAEGLNPLAIKKMGMKGPSFVSQDLYNNISGYGVYLVPMVAVVIVQAVMFFGIGICLGGWAEQRHEKSFARRVFLSGKNFSAVFTGFFIIAFAWSLILEGLGLWLLGMPTMLNFPASILGIAAFSLAITAAAMALALAMGTNHYAAGMVLASAPSLFLSGLVFPFENFATWVIPFAWILPTTPACRAVLFASQEGANLLEVLPLITANLVQFAIYGLLLNWLYRRRYCNSKHI